ncbi:MAG: hypothetical protein ACAH89_02535 [Rariglobus sp.]
MTTRPSPRIALFLALFAGLVCADVVSADPGNGKGKDKEKGNGNGNSSGFIPPGHRRAPVEVIVLQAPPALRVEVVTARPSAGHVWVTGYWVWGTEAYVWTPSVWVLPPEPAAVWVAPRYEERSGVHVSISGFWKI